MTLENLKWKMLERPLLPVMGSHVDAFAFLVLFALLFLSGLALKNKKSGFFRASLQIISFIFLVFVIHRCFGALRGWIFALKDIGKNELNVFYNLFIFVPLVAFTLMFGRVFCGWICPLGALQELSFRVPFFKKFILKESLVARCIKLSLLVIVFSLSIFFLIKLRPQTFFFLENVASFWGLALIGIVFIAIWRPALEMGLKKIRYLSLILWFILLISGVYTMDPWCALYVNGIDYSSILSLFIVLALTFLLSQPWCRYLCPLGSFLSLLVKYAPFKVRQVKNIPPEVAKNICPVEALGREAIDPGSCLYCARCIKAGFSKLEES